MGILTWEEVEASAQDSQTWRQRVALRIGDAWWIKSSQAYRRKWSAEPSINPKRDCVISLMQYTESVQFALSNKQ